MRIFITGVTGFVGECLAQELVKRGYEVAGLARYVSNRKNKNMSGVSLNYGDVLDTRALKTIFKKVQPDIIIHLAAQTSVYYSFLHPHEIYNVNFLGLTINEHLKWNDHLNKITSKISRSTGMLNKLKHIFPCDTLKLLYNSLILPQINYCILMWGHAPKQINKLQKKSVRIISKSKYNAHTEPILKNLKYLKVNDIYKLQLFKFYHKFINNKLPKYFYENNIISLVLCRTMRRNRIVQVPRIKHAYARNCVRYMVSVEVNKLTNMIRDKVYTHSLGGFSLYIKNNMLKNYQINCRIQNCYICQQNN